MCRPRLLAAAVVLWAAAPALAQFSEVELFRNVSAGVNATAESGENRVDRFPSIPPTTDPVLPGRGSIFYNLSADVAGASAKASGTIDYTISPLELTATGTFRGEATASGQAAALAGGDAVFALRFKVAQRTPYRLTGSVQTSKALSGLSEFLQCQVNGTVLAGHPFFVLAPGSAVTFEVLDREAFPGDPVQVECRAAKGVANDAYDLEWRFTVTLSGTPSTTTTTLPPTRKACRKTCGRAVKACRAACPGTGRDRRLCRKACKRAGRQCGQSTGCALPL